MHSKIQKILIVKPSSMGDIIHGLLVAESIKAQLPHVSIDWVVRSEFAPLVEAASLVEQTYIFDRSAGVRGFIRLIRAVRTKRYDVVLDMQGLARTGILTFAAHAKRKIGRSDARECAWLGYNEKTAPLPAGPTPHAVKILAAFLGVLGLEQALPASLAFDAPEVRVDLPAPIAAGKRVVLFPESRRVEKNWTSYEALTRWLLEQAGVGQVVWCGHVPFEPAEPLDAERFINLTDAQIDELSYGF